MSESDERESLEHVDVPLDRDLFMRKLIRALSGTLEDHVGLDEAAGFISLVGIQIGNQIERDYRGVDCSDEA